MSINGFQTGPDSVARVSFFGLEDVPELLRVSHTGSIGQVFEITSVDSDGNVTGVRAVDKPNVDIDATLSHSGSAADAKAVGDAINARCRYQSPPYTVQDTLFDEYMMATRAYYTDLDELELGREYILNMPKYVPPEGYSCYNDGSWFGHIKCDDGSVYEIVLNNPVRITRTGDKLTVYSGTNSHGYNVYDLTDRSTSSAITYEYKLVSVPVGNNIPYEPSTDYSPASKKYVDAVPAVRYAEQTLTEEQQMQARANLGVYNKQLRPLTILEGDPMSAGVAYNDSLEEGSTYVVELELVSSGVTLSWELTCYYAYDMATDIGMKYIGNGNMAAEAVGFEYTTLPDTGEPFAVYDFNGINVVFDESRLEQVDRIGVYKMRVLDPANIVPVCEKIPDEFLPDDLLRDADLDGAVNDALAQAKERGEFDGEDGNDGAAATLEIVGATALEYGAAPTVTEQEGSTAQARKYILGIPAGAPGESSAVVDYVRTEAEAVAERIIAITGEGNTDIIPFVVASPTDLHCIGGVRYLHTAQAIGVIKETAPIDVTVLLGDYIPNWTEMTKSESVECISALKKLFGDAVFLIGNHDKNQYPGQSIPKAEAFMRMCRANEWISNPDDPYGGYGFKDYPQHKIRVLFVNTSDNSHVAEPTSVNEGVVSPVINCHNITAKQLQWFADRGLDFSDKDAPSEWGIVILSHVPITNDTWAEYGDSAGNVWECNVQNFSNMLRAYVDKTAYSVTLNGESCTKDFSQNGEVAEVTVFINGHGHAEKVTTLNGFTHIWCPSVHPTTKVSDDGNTYGKTAGTAKETAFNAVVIDRANKKAHALIYGAGTDRVVDFSGAVSTKYSTTNTLTNCTNSNGATYVVEGESYSAIINPDSGYELSSVVVTMGGVDISSTAVSGGTITIASVTGNIVITAVATEVQTDSSYTNQIPISTDADGNLFVGTNGEEGYKTGYRLSLSSGNETAASGYKVTGFIPATQGDVIRIKDIDLTEENSTNIVGYDADKKPYNDGTASLYGTQLYHMFVTNGAESNGVYTATLDATIANAFGEGLAYIRIGSKSIAAESIVTVNEEIV